ncbi:hypothetical protein RKD37_001041 [Streptomyces ambofaciens]
MERYPASRAALTAAVVSASGTWKTPKPSCGISTPLLRVTVGILPLVAMVRVTFQVFQVVVRVVPVVRVVRV